MNWIRLPVGPGRPAPYGVARAVVAGALVSTVLLSFCTAPAAAAEEKVLNVYNWSDYIAEDTVRNFEKETGIKVRYDVFDTNEILHAKLVAGKSGYDVVVPSSYWGKLQADGGLLKKLDKSKLPNLKNLDPEIEATMAKIDPGNAYMVDWLWGYVTVGINVDKVKAALGALPMPDNAWDLLFKPEYVGKLKSCGVAVLDSPTDVIPAALHYLGKPPFSKDPADYRGVAPLLASIRPSITRFASGSQINDMANGATCLALAWSGDINIARQRAIDNKTGQHIEVLVPKTGAVLFFDTMVIPADAPHPENALAFINYVLRPDVAAALTNKVFYANPNKASLPLIKPAIAHDPKIFPPASELQKMALPAALTNDIRRLMTRAYTAFKTGV